MKRGPITIVWGELDEPTRGRVADKLLYGRYGALGFLRRAEHYATSRPDLALRAARTAAELYAGVGELGYVATQFEERIASLLKQIEPGEGS